MINVKMALKDWKKVGKTRFGRWEKSDGSILIILKANEFNPLQKDDIFTIQVYNKEYSDYFGNPFGRLFKTKSEALKFARAYMRTH